MKPETKEKMDKIVPLLAHLLDGGTLIRNHGLYSGAKHSMKDSDRIVNELILSPSGWATYVEPRVIYVNEDKEGFLGSYTVMALDPSKGFHRKVRFVEDLNWKPDLDADHHLPDHTPPHLK